MKKVTALAHDLNNLLSIVHINLELLYREAPDAYLRTLTEEALDAANLCSELIKNRTGERNGGTTRPPPLDINEELDAIGSLIRRVLGPEIQVEQNLAQDLGTVIADPAVLRNICLNLVVNARDAMASGDHLLITTSNVEIGDGAAPKWTDAKPGAYVRLALRDTGSGIPAEIMGRVFEPSFTTKRPGGSSGLGLTIVREACEQFGGFVRLESKVGKGTTVSIYLPRHDDRQAAR